MNKWYTVKAKYTKQLDTGALKRVTEPYLIAANSFTDAEARAFEELGQTIRGEFSVPNITPLNVSDIFAFDDCGEWFSCTASHEDIDSEATKPKKVRSLFLVEAQTVKQASERIHKQLAGVLPDYRLEGVKESKIMDIFPMPED